MRTASPTLSTTYLHVRLLPAGRPAAHTSALVCAYACVAAGWWHTSGRRPSLLTGIRGEVCLGAMFLPVPPSLSEATVDRPLRVHVVAPRTLLQAHRHRSRATTGRCRHPHVTTGRRHRPRVAAGQPSGVLQAERHYSTLR